MARATKVVLAVLTTIVCLAVIGLIYRHHENKRYLISGEVFTTSSDRVHMVPGAEIRIYRFELPASFPRIIFNSEMRSLASRDRSLKKEGGSPDACGSVPDIFKRLFGESTTQIDPQFLYRPFEKSTLDEWRSITADPAFRNLSAGKQSTIRRGFWLRRVRPSWQLEPTEEEELENQIFQGIEKPWKTAEEKKDFNKRYRSETPWPLTKTFSDSNGRFEVRLPKGTYILVAEGDVPYIEVVELKKRRQVLKWNLPAVWGAVVAVNSETKVVLADPFCSPYGLRGLQF